MLRLCSEWPQYSKDVIITSVTQERRLYELGLDMLRLCSRSSQNSARRRYNITSGTQQRRLCKLGLEMLYLCPGSSQKKTFTLPVSRNSEGAGWPQQPAQTLTLPVSCKSEGFTSSA